MGLCRKKHVNWTLERGCKCSNIPFAAVRAALHSSSGNPMVVKEAMASGFKGAGTGVGAATGAAAGVGATTGAAGITGAVGVGAGLGT